MVDLGVVATEFLSLGIDPYPRKAGVEFAAPAVEDDTPHPFAALAALKKGAGRFMSLSNRTGTRAPRRAMVDRGRRFRTINSPAAVDAPSRSSMPDKVRIALDAMGGDFGPSVIVPGAQVSLDRHPGIEFLLFGDRAADRAAGRGAPAAQGGVAHHPYRRRHRDGRQAEPGAAPGPLEVLDVDGDRRREARRGRSRGLRRQYRRADGAREIPAQDHGRHRPAGDRGALADGARRVDRARPRRQRSAPMPRISSISR